MQTTEQIKIHYGKSDIYEKIIKVLEENGKNINEISVSDLKPVDEFHIGGIEATIDLLKQLDIKKNTRVLDVGCGIGGLSRFIKSAYGSHITGIDLTPEFIETATKLTKLTGMHINFKQASALSIPEKDNSFDLATLLHVGMNIPEKFKLFNEISRILDSGGIFAVYDIMIVKKGKIDYPVPWASEEATSFLDSKEIYGSAAKSNDFILKSERNRSEFAIEFFNKLQSNIDDSGPIKLGLGLLMGKDAQIKIGNVLKAIEEGHVAPIEMIFNKI